MATDVGHPTATQSRPGPTAYDSPEAQTIRELSALLWQERELLEELVYRLSVQRLVLEAGEARFVNQSSRDIDVVIEALRATDVMRSISSDELADRMGRPTGCSLAELGAGCPEPYNELLQDHRSALIASSADVDALLALNRRLLDAGSRTVNETLTRISGWSGTYDAEGQHRRAATGPIVMDAHV